MEIFLPTKHPTFSSRPDTAGRSQAIDFLRGVAILLVLGCHVVLTPASAGPLRPLAEFWYHVGWAGVDLFFVLSGFLVTGLLFAEYARTGRVDGGRFLVRRGFKIWPAYFCYLAFLAAWLGWQGSHGKGAGAWHALWPNLLHVQNYLGTPRVHTWSLALEEHFYLVGALLAAWFLRPRAKAAALFPAAAVAAIAGVALARTAGFVPGDRSAMNLFATHLRCDGLLVGSLLAYVHHFSPGWLLGLRRHPVISLVAGLVLAAPALWLTPEHSAAMAGFGLTAMYAGFALVIVAVLGLEQRRAGQPAGQSASAYRWTARIGYFSYGIYLWHVDLAQTPLKKAGAWVTAHGWPDWAAWLAVTGGYVLLAVLAGACLSRAVELPFLKLRDRFFPSRTQRVAEAPKAARETPPPLLVPDTAGAHVAG
jgi:peptidoglycan/LPS O-acetylase OafA/YrhL